MSRRAGDDGAAAALARFARRRGRQAGEGAADDGAAAAEVRAAWEAAALVGDTAAIRRLREEALAALGDDRRWRRRLAAASVAVLVPVAAAWGPMSLRPGAHTPAAPVLHRYSSRVGEIEPVALPDGSLAVLDTATRLTYREAAGGGRTVDLVHGRAMFRVAKRGVPFTVRAAGMTVTALGTRFDAGLLGDGLDVHLVEGRLRVQRIAADGAGAGAVEMLAGDGLTAGRHRWYLVHGGAADALGWTRGQLVFDDQPIGAIVAMLNRYARVPMVIVDPALADRRISAVIRSDDTMMLVEALRVMGLGEAVRRPGAIELRLSRKYSSAGVRGSATPRS